MGDLTYEEIVELSRTLYEPFLDAQMRRELADMDESDQSYFWRLLYEEFPSHMKRSALKDMERSIAKANRGRKEPMSMFPMRDAEEKLSPHSFFKVRCI